MFVWREHSVCFYQVRVDEEVFDPVLRQNLLHTSSLKTLWRVVRTGSIERDGITPVARWPISALRNPYSARSFAQMFLVRLDSGTHLRPDRSVSPKQREVSVRC